MKLPDEPAHLIPAAFNSLFFCKNANLLASSSCLSLAFLFAFFPCVFANLARASDNISFSERGISITPTLASRRTVIIHIDRVGSSSPRLWIRIDLSGPQPPNIDTRLSFDVLPSPQTKFFIVLCLGVVKELLVPLQTLRRGTPYYRSDSPPLRGHQLGEMQEFLILRLGPFYFFD